MKTVLCLLSISPTALSTRDFGVGSFPRGSKASGLPKGTDSKRNLYLIVNVRYGQIIAHFSPSVNRTNPIFRPKRPKKRGGLANKAQIDYNYIKVQKV